MLVANVPSNSKRYRDCHQLCTYPLSLLHIMTLLLRNVDHISYMSFKTATLINFAAKTYTIQVPSVSHAHWFALYTEDIT